MNKIFVIQKKNYLVGVDGDAEQSRVSVDKEFHVTLRQVVDNRGLRKVGHVRQIFQKF